MGYRVFDCGLHNLIFLTVVSCMGCSILVRRHFVDKSTLFMNPICLVSLLGLYIEL